MELERFVGAALARHGCVVQPRDDERLEALLAVPVAAALRLPEDVCLRLHGSPAPGEIHAGYGSGLLAGLCALGEAVGRRYRLELAPSPPKRERVEREAQAVLNFRNGIARLESIRESAIEYLVFDFRYTALSEDRHEGLVSVAFDVEGGSSPALASGLAAYLAQHPGARRPWNADVACADPSGHLRRAHQLVLASALAQAQSFRTRMQRHQQRDARRIQEYYEALRHDVEGRRSRARDEPGVVEDKFAAIEAERQRRLQDLQRRYAVRLRIEPLAVLALRVHGIVLHARVQRRKSHGQVRLGWNAIAREFDRWTCDSCGMETRLPTLCGALHRLCPSCPPDCPSCGRSACPVCSGSACRCGRRQEGATDRAPTVPHSVTPQA